MSHYTLLDASGLPYRSGTPGTVGGHRRSKIYGRLDCPSALRAIASGGKLVIAGARATGSALLKRGISAPSAPAPS